jgi:hypothetical protein
MVAETWALNGVRLEQVVVQVDGVEERPPRVASVLGRDGQDVSQSVTASRGDNQHAKPARSQVLQPLIQSDLPLPTVGVLVGADSLCAVVQLDKEIKLLPVMGMQLKGAVGEQVVLADLKPQSVLSGEVLHLDAQPMRGNHSVDNELRKAVGVVLMGKGDFVEVPLCGRLGTRPV